MAGARVGGPSLGFEVSQGHALAPVAIQVLGLLRLPVAALEEVIADRVAVNPLLRREPPRRCAWCGDRLRSGRCPACAGQRDGALAHDPPERVDELDALRRDARSLLPAALGPIADRVVVLLDAHGLLREDLDEVAAIVGTTPEEASRVIAAVRAAGPPGIAARNGVDCLVAQAAWHVERGAPPTLVEVVRDHLAEVADGDHRGIGRSLGISEAEVDVAVSFLRRHLRPFVTYEAAVPEVAPAPPDVLLRWHPDDPQRLVVDVPGARDLGVVIDSELLAFGASNEATAWLDRHRGDAVAFLELLDRRAGSLRRIVHAVATAQRAFIADGPASHVSLSRTEVAAVLGLHVSTVSRAVDGKRARLPSGEIVPMSVFFEPALPAKVALRDLLASETRRRSDAWLAERLASSGHPVARRTVNKYRRALASGRPLPV